MSRRTNLRPGKPRWDEIIKSSRTAGRRGRLPRGARRGLVYALVVVGVFALLGAGILAYVQLRLKSNSEQIPELSSQRPDEPMNVLVLGSDSRAVLPEEELAKFDPTGEDRESGQRADTIILIHLDEKREQALLIHFPRDLRVTYPNGKIGKINGVYSLGTGPLVDTVESFTRLPVHHFVEVNFVGFRNIVNALGGVHVFFEEPINEPDSGLNVPAGCTELKGDQALAFVRVRKIDDDFGRIRRQQLFMSLMMERITSAGTLLNPIRVVRLVNQISSNVTTDADLSISDAQKLAFRLQGFDPERVDMRVVPSSPARIGGVSYVIHHQGQTDALFQAIRERQSLPDYGRTGVSAIDPAGVRVSVLNGTTVDGLAAKAAEELTARSFQVAGKPSNADRSDYAKTTAFYKEGYEQQARLVGGFYGAEVKPLPGAIIAEGEVVLVVGTDFAEGRATPPPPPPPGQPPAKPLIHRCDS
jgi:LCP family protein required for cell wall assembly